MPLLSNTPPSWLATDAEQLAGFLQTSTGQRFISQLLFSRPDYRPFSSIEERAVQSGIIDGFEKCITAIDSLTKTK